MNRVTESRLNAIESMIKAQYKRGVWIDAFDEKVRVDRGTSRGKIQSFPTVAAGIQYITGVINQEEKVNGSVFVIDICDLYPNNTEQLKSKVKEILGEKYPLSCLMTLLGIKNMHQVDLRIIALRNIAHGYFSTVGFQERYTKQNFTNEDYQMFDALSILYSEMYLEIFPNENKEKAFEDYCTFVIEAGRLPVPAMASQNELNDPEIRKISAAVILQAVHDLIGKDFAKSEHAKEWLLSEDCEIYLSVLEVDSVLFRNLVKSGAFADIDFRTIKTKIVEKEVEL